MRILHVIANLSLDRGGPPRAAIGLCRALARQGQSIYLYTTNESGDTVFNVPTDRPVADEGVAIYYFPISRWRRWGLSWPLGAALRSTILNFDLVHIHSLYLYHTMVAAHYCRAYHVPYIMRPHGTLDPYLRRKNRFKKAVYNWLIEQRNLNQAAAIHYTSQGEMALAHSALHISAPGIVVPLGIEPAEYAIESHRGSLRERYPEIGDRFLFLFLGRLNFKKGLDLLAKAYGNVARQRADVHLVIAGPDQDGFGQQVHAWLAYEGILDRVTFTGMLVGDDKLAALADADVFVLPSYTENFGIAVVEAMACGLPVIVSNRVNIWDQIAAHDAGMIVDCNATQLAAAMGEAARDRSRLSMQGANGKRLVQDRYTWASAAGQMTDVYERILNHTL